MTPESFVLDSVLERLIPLRAEEEGVRLAEDPEYLHRMRVATRRLRSALPLLAESVSAGDLALWSREIRRFTRALGRARDGDVQIIFLKELIDTWEDRALRPGLERLLLRRSQRRDRLQKGLIRELDRIFRRGGALETLEGEIRRQRVAQALGETPPELAPLRRRGATLLLLRLEALEGGSAALGRPGDGDGHHALRILAKKLRYTLELFAPLMPPTGEAGALLRRLKDLQGILGDLHDCDVWIQELPLFIRDERRRTESYQGHLRGFSRIERGLMAFWQDRRREREILFSRSREMWRSWGEDRVTERLREAFRALVEEREGGEER